MEKTLLISYSTPQALGRGSSVSLFELILLEQPEKTLLSLVCYCLWDGSALVTNPHLGEARNKVATIPLLGMAQLLQDSGHY